MITFLLSHFSSRPTAQFEPLHAHPHPRSTPGCGVGRHLLRRQCSSGPGAAAAAATNLNALASQHRLLELSRFGLRGYDLAQHMLSQQGAVSKLLGE